jgi:hypothetical protein
MFTNICCISLCPIIMVAIAGIMGIVIQQLIDSSNPPDGNQYANLNILLLSDYLMSTTK